ncbi:hypothetical protein ABZ891_26585 [Streptomyces sp. NPDC047023]|uniref:hypothetical protein n=1 Tax=Streptomyces sp. NPDC047023 TaxID=3155139 RepID=UPI0033C565CE
MDSLAISVLGRLAHYELHDAATTATNRLGGALSDAGVVILGDFATALLLAATSTRAPTSPASSRRPRPRSPTPWAANGPLASPPDSPTTRPTSILRARRFYTAEELLQSVQAVGDLGDHPKP